MRSLIILEVEHGETTDPLTSALDTEVHKFLAEHGITLNDYTVRVDLPACFVLDSDNTNTGTCQSHTDIHYFSDDCVGWKDSI